MSGAGFGAFMGGLSGGMAAGKGISEMSNKMPSMSGAPGAKASDYSGDLSKFVPGAPGAAEAAAPPEEPGFMDKLNGWMAEMPDKIGDSAKSLPMGGGIAGALAGKAGDSIAGKLMGGGFGSTILGKFLK